MASTSQASGLDSQDRVDPEAPAIHAIFLINFDLRKGYVIAWKKTLPDVKIDGAVEFKSLPSGLHNVREDLIYFRHEDYIGLSAFVNEPADEASRNARMLAVGVLLPSGKGRMNKSWIYAEPLQELARKLATDPDEISPLEKFWDERRHREEHYNNAEDNGSPREGKGPRKSSQSIYSRTRGMSDSRVMLGSDRSLPTNHPATSVPELIDSFGPLIFPLYRAALLRKRLLILGEAPVRTNCHFVYDLSILASIPSNLLPFLPYDKLPDLHVKPLFNVGLYDTGSLTPASRDDKPDFNSSWIACTTDDVLATKPHLYDILVKLPPSYAKDAPSKVFPKIEHSHPSHAKPPLKTTEIKATQRDARRYQNLQYDLRTRSSSEERNEPVADEPEGRPQSPERPPSTFSDSSVVEPTSWSLAVYTSLVWWASAGEKGGPSDQEAAEMEQDRSLFLQDLSGNDSSPWPSTGEASSISTPELALVAYFQRLTGLLVSVISEAIERQDFPEDDDGQSLRGRRSRKSAYSDTQDADEPGEATDQQPLIAPHEREDDPDDDGQNDEPVEITSDDLINMGLDPWSASDRTFVEEMLELWWGRRANLRGGHFECCGIRLR